MREQAGGETHVDGIGDFYRTILRNNFSDFNNRVEGIISGPTKSVARIPSNDILRNGYGVNSNPKIDTTRFVIAIKVVTPQGSQKRKRLYKKASPLSEVRIKTAYLEPSWKFSNDAISLSWG
ncbi:MAG: hypothetical protein MR738_01230 [Enterocloster clostridioformis]|uniref:hypothetical protein n=1 Tax=Enterocloster clostridioformis TaxID=1531 RepID=UPI00242B03B2|nr:hypothetical protein [Enterocloster clostridioformis]MCI6124717.1 hypothetical protein [Enterocloster clostridioformis]MDY4764016.1 hypothetical protein [Enterocloster clostridioformis]